MTKTNLVFYFKSVQQTQKYAQWIFYREQPCSMLKIFLANPKFCPTNFAKLVCKLVHPLLLIFIFQIKVDSFNVLKQFITWKIHSQHQLHSKNYNFTSSITIHSKSHIRAQNLKTHQEHHFMNQKKFIINYIKTKNTKWAPLTTTKKKKTQVSEGLFSQ